MSNTKEVGTNLTSGPIMKTLIIFAIPIILTNLIQQLYSLVDVAVIGQYVGSVGTVAVNTGGEMADMVSPFAMGFAMAGQIFIAQLVGQHDDARVKRSIGTLITFTLLLSFILMAVAIIGCSPILSLLNCPEEAFTEAIKYMVITAIGYPFIFGYNAVCGALRGMGESKKPMYFIIVAAVVNIFLDILLVAVFKMEATGTAIATVVSQFGSFVAAFFYLWKNREAFDFELKFSYFKMDMHILGRLIRLAIPQVARSLMVRTGMLWVNSSANAYGLVVSATNSVGNKLQKLLEVFVSGIDTASASMIGQNLGAHDTKRAGKVTICTVIAAEVCALASAALCLLCPRLIFGLFTSDPEVIELGVTFLRIFVLHFFASAFTGSFQAMVTGCGFVELGFVLGALDGLICKIGFSILFMNVFGLGYIGLWWGVACSRIIPGFICLGYFISGKWKTRKLVTD